jgi:hypothetical protein
MLQATMMMMLLLFVLSGGEITSGEKDDFDYDLFSEGW